MGLFDFLKRKEFQRIKELEIENTSLKSEITQLQARVNALEKYLPLENIELEIESLNRKKDFAQRDYDKLKNDYSVAFGTYQNLRSQIVVFQEDLRMADFGVYEPHFSFDSSEEYKEKITSIREKQKQMVKDGHAVYGGENITWNDSLSKGRAIVNRVKRLMMRAFNGESNSFISDVDWNNVVRMEERIEKSFEAINKTYTEQGVYISHRYKDLKLDELRLTFEYKKKQQEEKEEQRAIREQMREEERAERELEAAKLKAEKEEAMYLKALEKARKEMGTAVGKKQEELLKRIAELEAGLVDAETLKQKAISMAQQTKMGYVYVISNIGSFGEDVYKIGMTRRLEPLDRVRELGDASVPFPFDVHAMIFSENAPELEMKLHSVFSDNRVNMTNFRREFFNISLSKVEEEAKKLGAKVEFTMLAEASEYRETQRIKESKEQEENEKVDAFPNAI